MKRSERNQIQKLRNCAPLEALWRGGGGGGAGGCRFLAKSIPALLPLLAVNEGKAAPDCVFDKIVEINLAIYKISRLAHLAFQSFYDLQQVKTFHLTQPASQFSLIQKFSREEYTVANL